MSEREQEHHGGRGPHVGPAGTGLTNADLLGQADRQPGRERDASRPISSTDVVTATARLCGLPISWMAMPSRLDTSTSGAHRVDRARVPAVGVAQPAVVDAR